MVRLFHSEYISGPRHAPRDIGGLAALLDNIFVENRRILEAAVHHHRSCVPVEKPFDYVAPTLTRYGRLTHDANRSPRIEVSFALMHYEKALREFNEIKAAELKRDAEAAFFHGVYCVVAVAACAEAIANKLMFHQTNAHPDYRDRRQPLQKMNDAAAALAKAAGQTYVPLVAGHPSFEALDRVRELRNAFMHAKERDTEVDPVALTSTMFTAVDEAQCRGYLYNLRRAVEHIYEQLPGYAAPIVTRGNVKWLGDLEVP
jgi:hypothetical protein